MNTLNQLLTSLNHDVTRDLAWTIFAPQLFIHPELPAFIPALNEDRISWLRAMDNQPDRLQRCFDSAKSLGKYHEALWTLFFEHDHQFQLIRHNLAVRNNNKTIGEFDYIIKDLKQNCYLHLEVSVKYYLCFTAHSSQSAGDKNSWLGPNCRDTLQKKWSKLCNSQSQLSRHPVSVKILSDLGIEQINKSISFKGYLFSTTSNQKKPEDFNQNNSVFQWYYIDQFSAKPPNHRTLALIPRKSWMRNIHQPESIELIDSTRMIARVKEANTPLLAANIEKTGNCLKETERFFIAPDSWPYCQV